MKLIGKALFAPGQMPEYSDIIVCEDERELMRAYCGAFDYECVTCRAFTVLYEVVPRKRKLATLYFNWNDCEIPIVVHECVHAAEHYAAVSRKSPKLKEMKRSERAEYLDELLPVLTENLVSQTWMAISLLKNSQL